MINKKKAHYYYVIHRQYGVTKEEYDTMYESQGGVCAMCKHPETAKDPKHGKIRELAVDHDHLTGRVRGLLCGRCNTGIGKFGDNLDVTIQYLTQYSQHIDIQNSNKEFEAQCVR